MDNIILYFENIPSSHRAAILAGGIALFWLIESKFPLIKFLHNKWQHAALNIFFTLTTILVNFALAFLLLKSAQFTQEKQFGILEWLPETPLFLYALIGLLGLDLVGAYLAHLVQHKMAPLWKFHLIHHTDIWVNTTTANRHHPGESVIRFAFTVLGVLLFGTPMWLVFLYQSLSVVFSQFNHANIGIPKKIEKYLSYIIVSPEMHKVHHHYKLPYTDSNYGNIFSIWDRIFGTYMKLESDKIIYGIDTHPDEKEHNRLSYLMRLPFTKYRAPSEPEQSNHN